jgi:hypothetical protein
MDATIVATPSAGLDRLSPVDAPGDRPIRPSRPRSGGVRPPPRAARPIGRIHIINTLMTVMTE